MTTTKDNTGAASGLSAAAGYVLSGQERSDFGKYWDKAIEVTRERVNPSVAAIQRHCRVGYSRGQRILDAMIGLGWVWVIPQPPGKLLPFYKKTEDFPSHTSGEQARSDSGVA